MSNPIATYLVDLHEQTVIGWNRFWFTARAPDGVCLIRALAGMGGFAFVWSHMADSEIWFGTNGLLPATTVERLVDSLDSGASHQWLSPLTYLESSTSLWAWHGFALFVMAALAVGLASRVAVVAALVVVLSYVHRAPLITGLSEPLLSMLLFYLCFTPCGACWSVDRWWANRKARRNDQALTDPALSVGATIGTRLIQVHLSALYISLGLSKLGAETWWTGDAVWWLLARSETRLVDLTFLHDATYLINAWTHAIIAFELLFGVLVWNRLARPLLLVLAVVMWSLFAVLTSLIGFAALMLVAHLSFIEPERLRDVWRALTRRDDLPA